jgi:hypothetical protein
MEVSTNNIKDTKLSCHSQFPLPEDLPQPPPLFLTSICVRTLVELSYKFFILNTFPLIVLLLIAYRNVTMLLY